MANPCSRQRELHKGRDADFKAGLRAYSRRYQLVQEEECKEKTPNEPFQQEIGLAKLFGFRKWFCNHAVIKDFDDVVDLQTEIDYHKMVIFAHHLKVLDGIQVDEDSGSEVIKKKYRQLELLIHPDKNRHPKAEVAFKLVSEQRTPHLSGIAALVKSKHPDWSPSAIKSAITTTSNVKSRDGKSITDEQHNLASYYVMGSGHVNPKKATDPGVVYDLGRKGYIGFLCGLNYTENQMEIVTGEKISCSSIKKIDLLELN